MNDQTSDNEVGETCDTYGENMIACKILLGKPEERDYMKDIDVDSGIFNTIGDVGWINLFRCGVTWWTIVNTVMKLRVTYMRGI